MNNFLEEIQQDYKNAGLRSKLLRESILPSNDEMYLFEVKSKCYEVWVNGLCVNTFLNKHDAEWYMHLLFVRAAEKRHRSSKKIKNKNEIIRLNRHRRIV